MKDMKEWKTEQTTIRLPAELKEQLHRKADSIGVSFNELVIKLIWVGIENYSII